MSRKDRRRRVDWQTPRANGDIYRIMLNHLMQAATARYKWHNLPPTVNPWILEQLLLTRGVCTIMRPKPQDNPLGEWRVTQIAATGRMDIYALPVSWRSIGLNGGYQYSCDATNAVLVLDNPEMYPLMATLDYYARELESIMTTKRVNRIQARTPFIFTAPQGKEYDLTQVVKSVMGGEPAVMGYSSLDDIKVAAVQTGVPWLGDKLMTDFQDTLKQAYACMGIESARVKSERMVADEVTADTQPTAVIALASMQMRQMACDEFNRRFNSDAPVFVTWNTDNVTPAYNYEQNPNPEAGNDNAI